MNCGKCGEKINTMEELGEHICDTEKNTVKSLDTDKLSDALMQYFEEPTELDDRFDYMWITFIHIMLTTLTAGFWLLIVFAVWCYKFKNYLDENSISVRSEWEKVET